MTHINKMKRVLYALIALSVFTSTAFVGGAAAQTDGEIPDRTELTDQLAEGDTYTSGVDNPYDITVDSLDESNQTVTVTVTNDIGGTDTVTLDQSTGHKFVFDGTEVEAVLENPAFPSTGVVDFEFTRPVENGEEYMTQESYSSTGSVGDSYNLDIGDYSTEIVNETSSTIDVEVTHNPSSSTETVTLSTSGERKFVFSGSSNQIEIGTPDGSLLDFWLLTTYDGDGVVTTDDTSGDSTNDTDDTSTNDSNDVLGTGLGDGSDGDTIFIAGAVILVIGALALVARE